MARTRDPLAAIVTFAMTQPIDVVKAQLMTLNTIVKTREANESAKPGQVRVRQRPPARAPQQPAVRTGTAPGATEAAKPAAAAPAPQPAATATSTPRRRRGRPTGSTKTTGAMPPLGQGTTAANTTATPAPAPVVAQSASSRPPVTGDDAPAPGAAFPPQN